MKRNLTIKTEVIDEQFNIVFLEKMKSGDLNGRDEYWVQTISNMMDKALNKLRKEFALQNNEVKKDEE